MTELAAEPPIRDAATVILVRDAVAGPRVLMGQRGKSAVFMPEKVVFPGGAVDQGDADVSLAAPLGEVCRSRLLQLSKASPESLAAAAIREVYEETGLAIGRTEPWPEPPADWSDFAARGMRPDAAGLRFFFRAITPRGRPRRFDARFFLADADRLAGDIEGFADASTELSHLRWVPLSDVRTLDLAFITRLVLAELAHHLPSLDAPGAVPFVRNDRFDRGVTWLR